MDDEPSPWLRTRLAIQAEARQRPAGVTPPQDCKFCGGYHPSPESLSDDELRTVAGLMVNGKVAWSPVCQPSMALAHGVLRLLERLDSEGRP